MAVNNTSVDSYLQDGCGRCQHFQTPQCKVHRWHDGLVALRQLLQRTALVETMKWGSPCYTLDGRNVLIISAFIDWFGLSFFAGAALDDPAGLLQAPGPNSHHARVLKLTSMAELLEHQQAVQACVERAIAAAQQGVSTAGPRAREPVPAELAAVLEGDAALRVAFDALSPGRQRSHVLHVGGAKTASARQARAARCAAKIREGKGFLDR